MENDITTEEILDAAENAKSGEVVKDDIELLKEQLGDVDSGIAVTADYSWLNKVKSKNEGSTKDIQVGTMSKDKVEEAVLGKAVVAPKIATKEVKTQKKVEGLNLNSLVGKSVSDAKAELEASGKVSSVRVLPLGSMMTMDHVVGRVNLFHDVKKTVIHVSEG